MAYVKPEEFLTLIVFFLKPISRRIHCTMIKYKKRKYRSPPISLVISVNHLIAFINNVSNLT